MLDSTNWNRYPDFQSVQYGFESHIQYKTCRCGGMVDTLGSEPRARKGIWVRVPSSVLKKFFDILDTFGAVADVVYALD